MIYGTTTLKEVIAKVFADLNLQDGTYPISDFVTWAAEALKKIGGFPSFETKVAGKGGEPLLILNNYQTFLPNEFYRILQVSYCETSTGNFIPMRYATGSYDAVPELTIDLDDTELDSIVSDSNLIILAMEIYGLDYEAALAKINSEPDTRTLLTSLFINKTNSNKDATSYSFDYTYTLTSRYIKTNIKSGYLMVSYQAVPVDSEGYPKIPDDEAFKEAIYWYIVMKLKFPEWAEGRVRDAVYYRIENKWNYYCKQAYGNAMMPNNDQLESIKNVWLRLVPEINAQDTFYEHIGQQEIIYNQNHR